MRTTLTLDDDVVFGLKRMQDIDPQKSFKTVVNEILRKGLNGVEKTPKKRFKVESSPIGLRTDLNFDNIEEVLDILDGVNRL